MPRELNPLTLDETSGDVGNTSSSELAIGMQRSRTEILTHNRGIYLMKTLLDEVGFDHRGAVVYMRKASNTRPREDKWHERKACTNCIRCWIAYY